MMKLLPVRVSIELFKRQTNATNDVGIDTDRLRCIKASLTVRRHHIVLIDAVTADPKTTDERLGDAVAIQRGAAGEEYNAVLVRQWLHDAGSIDDHSRIAWVTEIGGLTGLFLAAIGLDVHVTDTYFIVAHFHYIMVGGTIMGYLGGLHYWWPKISGRLYNEALAKLSAGIIFIGFNLTFFPQFVVGYLGMPRRYHAYPPEFQVLNVLSSAGASILGVGYMIPMIYLMWSLRYGPQAGSNPWGAVGLEWTTTSPPPTENFAETPVVTWEPYEYSPR